MHRSEKIKKEPAATIVEDVLGECTVDQQERGRYLEAKAESLRWMLSIAGALLAYLVVALVVSALYHPDIDALKTIAKSQLIEYGKAEPEPMEALLFRLGIAIILPCLALFYFLLRRAGKLALSVHKEKLYAAKSTLSLALLASYIFVGFAWHNESEFGRRNFTPPDDITNNNFNFYFYGFFLGNYLWLYLFAIVPVVYWLFVDGYQRLRSRVPKISLAIPVAGYVVTGGTLMAIVLMNVFSFPYTVDNKIDFNAVYYSVTQVYAGLPMLVHGFTNTYGLYPHFLNPLFQVIGLDIYKFTVVMSVLLGCTYVLNFLAVRKFVRNRVILFLGFSTMLFFSYLNRKLVNEFDSYFALFPIRFIAPSVLVFLASVYSIRASAWLYWTTLIVSATFILWNPELGLVCYVSAVLYFFYSRSLAAGKVAWRMLATQLGAAVIVPVAVFYAYKIIIYLTYGSVPDVTLLWRTMTVFSKVGFGLLPMPLVHPWNLIALIIICGFMYSIACWYQKRATARASMVFLLSLISLGYLFYYQGRSHSANLSVSSGFSILLLTILGDELWVAAKAYRLFFLRGMFALILVLISFSFIELVGGAGRIVTYPNNEEDNGRQAAEQRFVEANREFVLQYSSEDESILVLTVAKHQSLYFDGYRRRSAFNPGLVDMFLNADTARFRQTVRDSAVSIFVERALMNYTYMQPTMATIAALYQTNSTGKSMALVQRRKVQIPAASFLERQPHFFYRKYRDDSAGTASRVTDAFASAPCALAPGFSAQVLFYASPQAYRYSALIGNLQHEKGFVISNDLSTGNFIFAVNNSMCAVKVHNNSWQYFVMNVYPDRIEAFVNGELAGTERLPGPVMQSEMPLTVGNLGYMHYYVGAIAEVAVSNGPVSHEEMITNWEKIREAVK